MNKSNIIAFICCLFILTSASFGQKRVKVELTEASLQTLNRSAVISPDSRKGKVVKVSGKPGPGIIWIKDTAFKSGWITFDVKGKDILQESFVGLAFHGINDTTYEAIYFRPFNFRAEDPIRKKHAVQYIALPQYDWPYLREKFADVYESTVSKDIDPDQWFHVKIHVNTDLIKVYVNEHKEPVLIVKPLQNVVNGKIGFWTGNNSDGDFSNLTMTSGN